MRRTTILVLLAGCGSGCSGGSEVVEIKLASPLGSEAANWRLACEVTGRGDEKAAEDFNPAYLVSLANRGVMLDRQYAGTRVSLLAEVTRPTRGVPKGQYTVFGTVTEIDATAATARLTDCVFKPAK